MILTCTSTMGAVAALRKAELALVPSSVSNQVSILTTATRSLLHMAHHTPQPIINHRAASG
jgi:hypothetical protein